MDDLTHVCKKHALPTPEEIIRDDPERIHLFGLGIKKESLDTASKIDKINNILKKINTGSQQEILKEQIVWLKAAYKYCNELFRLIQPESLLGMAIKYEYEINEPVGFSDIWGIVRETLNDKEKQLKELDEKGRQALKNTKKPGSNASRLHIADEWMGPIVRDLKELKFPRHEEVLKLLRVLYPNFENQYIDSKDSKFAKGGNLNKEAVNRALAFIFKKQTGEIIGTDAIRRRYWESEIEK